MPHYTDIHIHIMPGVDDGAKDLECSMNMFRIAQKEGISKMILTPHQKPDRRCVSVKGIQNRIEMLREELRQKHIGIEVYPGSELLYYSELSEQLEAGNVCSLAGSHYVLTEFLPNESWEYIRDGLYDLSSSGYWPVIAHAERCAALVKNPDRLEELIEMGCYVQMNAGSLTGDFGFGLKHASRKMVKEGLVHFIGTDAHSDKGKRIPKIKRCAEWLNKKIGKTAADRMLFESAEAIFANQEIN